jgi:aminobenzoyl-glutamate utilization protein B
MAGRAVKDYLVAIQVAGTIRVYGTPAEEGGSGKVYMIRAGLFRDVDAVLHWHPGTQNFVTNGGALANVHAKFRFTGRASHAAVAPERGRSALDAVMLSGVAVEMLREHIPANARVHYVINNGGAAPNVVPEAAELDLYARHPSQPILETIWPRILKCAQGAALATETTHEVSIIGATSSILSNDVLARVMERNLRRVGGITYSPEERSFAEALAKTFPEGSAGQMGSERDIQPIRRSDPNAASASTDAGDVTWVVPTIGVTIATAVPGTPGHSWQNTACAGSSIGRKGMVNAAKVLALTALDLFTEPGVLAEARADFDKQRAGREYRSLIPEGNKPPLTFRKD